MSGRINRLGFQPHKGSQIHVHREPTLDLTFTSFTFRMRRLWIMHGAALLAAGSALVSINTFIISSLRSTHARL